MTDQLLPIRCLSAISLLDSSLEGWSLLGEVENPEVPRSAARAITFDQPFMAPPVLHVGIVGLDVNREHNTRLRVRALDVTASGFLLQAETWLTSQVWSVEISWLAIGS